MQQPRSTNSTRTPKGQHARPMLEIESIIDEPHTNAVLLLSDSTSNDDLAPLCNTPECIAVDADSINNNAGDRGSNTTATTSQVVASQDSDGIELIEDAQMITTKTSTQHRAPGKPATTTTPSLVRPVQTPQLTSTLSWTTRPVPTHVPSPSPNITTTATSTRLTATKTATTMTTRITTNSTTTTTTKVPNSLLAMFANVHKKAAAGSQSEDSQSEDSQSQPHLLHSDADEDEEEEEHGVVGGFAAACDVDASATMVPRVGLLWTTDSSSSDDDVNNGALRQLIHTLNSSSSPPPSPPLMHGCKQHHSNATCIDDDDDDGSTTSEQQELQNFRLEYHSTSKFDQEEQDDDDDGDDASSIPAIRTYSTKNSRKVCGYRRLYGRCQATAN
jgi:hypothetical protein